jgi:hypothetical protein
LIAALRRVRRRVRCLRRGHKWIYRRLDLTGDDRVRQCLRCGRSEAVDQAARAARMPHRHAT